MIPTYHYIILSAILFGIGLFGALSRKNVIIIFMSIELMLNAANLAFVSFSSQQHNLDGVMITFFIVVIAAAEAVVGLAIMLAMFRQRQTLEVDQMNIMKS